MGSWSPKVVYFQTYEWAQSTILIEEIELFNELARSLCPDHYLLPRTWSMVLRLSVSDQLPKIPLETTQMAFPDGEEVILGLSNF